jgi:uncharacterized protein (TIGR02145 family)
MNMKTKLSFMLAMMAALIFAGCGEQKPDDVTITPTTEYTITVNAGDGGAATATIDGGAAAKAAEGKVVTLTATPDEGYEFLNWTTTTEGLTITDPQTASTTFTMPAGNVVVSAEFALINIPPDEDGVIINGIMWAKYNIDAPDTFAATPEDPGMVYQWNRKLGWSSTDPLIASDGSEDWQNPSVVPGEIWAAENDPSPEGWRVPTREELLSLTDENKISYQWVTGSEGSACPGLRLTDKATGNTMFLPAPGVRYGLIFGQLMLNTDDYEGIRGASYWTSEAADSDKSYAIHFTNAFGFITDQSYTKNDGFLVRPVADIQP